MAKSDVPLTVHDTGGGGRPVVLIHGWPLSSDSWSGQVDTLAADGFRVITYDRRGFGSSPAAGVDSGEGSAYDYDTLADDLHQVVTSLKLRDVTLVGFSMGGGEVARYASRHGLDRVHSVVFAAAVPPCLMKSEDNPDGPLDEESFQQMRQTLDQDRAAFFAEFVTGFFSVGGFLLATAAQHREAVELAHLSDERAALECMDAWGRTDFRRDLEVIDVPALIIHGDGDATVPLEGSGQRTFQALERADMAVITGAPHGLNVTHRDQFNEALLKFLHR